MVEVVGEGQRGGREGNGGVGGEEEGKGDEGRGREGREGGFLCGLDQRFCRVGFFFEGGGLVGICVVVVGD